MVRCCSKRKIRVPVPKKIVIDVEEVSATEEDYDSADSYMLDNYVHEDVGRIYEYCANVAVTRMATLLVWIQSNVIFVVSVVSLLNTVCLGEGSCDSGYVPPAY
ncbi:hypothetical protein RchiOBHm_Chr5g0002221 [Rosa chinensis]|uniref:Uncharacterized protein n=1 Tax=Rosa chinensis TaxID=74649 RepID=A0A2P6Q2E2_ROSCH|nr:hypothetical protein RchiOBHm_Chr5g0002221 [Rosa chinensis]